MDRSFTFLVNFIPKYFIIFDAILNGIAFLISLLDNVLLMCRNATDFCMLILYTATLMNSFISSNSFLVESLGFYIYIRSCRLQTDYFISSFPVWMPCISFSWLISLARTLSTLLNRSGESGHPCLVPDLWEKTFSFLPLNMVLPVSLSYIPSLCWGTFLQYLFVGNFYHERMLNFVKCFFYICWNDHVIFILRFVNMVYHIDWFAEVEPSLYPRDKSHLMVYDAFNVLLNSFF